MKSNKAFWFNLFIYLRLITYYSRKINCYCAICVL